MSTIRTIHHLSCSGGTLVSKCIASMDGIALLSEVHPYNIGRVRFNPFDPLQQLYAQYHQLQEKEEVERVFRDRVDQAVRLTSRAGLDLVLRDHAHSDYLHRKPPSGRSQKSLLNVLKGAYEPLSILTIRDPADAYLSMCNNGWSGGVGSFNDYCRRVALMLEAYRGVKVFKYEDFCQDPDRCLKDMCEELCIPFDPSYREKFFSVQLTGDSGRGKKIKEISPLPKRLYDEGYRDEVNSSEAYREIRRELGY